MNTETNRTLRNKAILLGLCPEWQKRWEKPLPKDKLIAMYKEGQDFCIRHDYPSPDEIRSLFTPEELERGGVYLDADIDTTLHNGVFIFLGSCKGKIRLPRWCAAQLWCRGDTRIEIEAGENSRIQVRLYDRSDATVSPATSRSSSIHIFDRRESPQSRTQKEDTHVDTALPSRPAQLPDG